MNSIWRFYTGQDRRWRWQCLSTDKSVILESLAAYKEYEGCMADAREQGYVFEPSQARMLRPNSRAETKPGK